MLSCGIEKMVRNMYLERKCKTYLPENFKIFVKFRTSPVWHQSFTVNLRSTMIYKLYISSYIGLLYR